MSITILLLTFMVAGLFLYCRMLTRQLIQIAQAHNTVVVAINGIIQYHNELVGFHNELTKRVAALEEHLVEPLPLMEVLPAEDFAA